METLERMDILFLKKFQKISDWLQKWTGVNNFGIAKFLLALSVFSSISEKIHLMYAGKADWLTIVSLVIFFLLGAIIWFYTIEAEHTCRNSPQFSNINIERLKFFRRVEMIFLVPFTMGFLGTILTIGNKNFHTQLSIIFYDLYRITYFFVLFFASCKPKPHKPSKVKEAIEKLKPKAPEVTTVKV